MSRAIFIPRARLASIRPLRLGVLILATACVATPTAAAGGKIYRTVDENGNVVFTDVPPRAGEQGESVNLEQPTNYFTPPSTPAESVTAAPAPEASSGPDAWRVREGDEEEAEEPPAAAVDYQQLRIVRPAHDQAIRDNAGNVAVVARVEPALQAGHVMQVYLDGALRQSGTTTTFPLVNVDRGTHSVAVRIVDERSGETLAASEPVVFHLQRRSVLLQPGNRGGK